MSEMATLRKIRSAIGRIRRSRRQKRYAAIGLLAFLTTGVLSAIALNYVGDSNQDIGEARGIHVEYTMPAFPPVMVPAELPKAPVPELLNLGGLYPDSDGYVSHRPDAEPKKKSADHSGQAGIVILDDLRAAPPKSIFIKAIFGLPAIEYKAQHNRWGERDRGHHGHHHGHHGHHHPHDPPIPEPSTGLLLGLGLTLIGMTRRRARAATSSGASVASPPSQSNELTQGV